jgi:hypothetical protein
MRDISMNLVPYSRVKFTHPANYLNCNTNNTLKPSEEFENFINDPGYKYLNWKRPVYKELLKGESIIS